MTYSDWLIMTGGKTTITEECFNEMVINIAKEKANQSFVVKLWSLIKSKFS